jgi:hypothetical protein
MHAVADYRKYLLDGIAGVLRHAADALLVATAKYPIPESRPIVSSDKGVKLCGPGMWLYKYYRGKIFGETFRVLTAAKYV